MRGKISIHDLKVHCFVGVHPHEKTAEQEIAIDIEMEADLQTASLNDSIIDTINYEKVAALCRSHVLSKKYNLLETIAFELVHLIMEKFPLIEKTRVCAIKKGALPLAAYTSAEFEIEREI